MNLAKTVEILKKYDKNLEELFFKGNLELLKKPKIAIVGSRRPLGYTKQIIAKLASEISKSGGVTVSGGAMGCDSLAHEFSYPNTIAVFANSLDIIYPKVCKNLIEKIYQNALALSKYPSSTTARKHFFLERNKLVVGISDAVIVAQGDKKSGSMFSANFAIENKKPLFVLPHQIGQSEGTNELLAQEKAKAIYNIDEFLKQIGLLKQKQNELDLFANLPDLESLNDEQKSKVFELELEGKVAIQNNKVIVL